MTRQDAIKKLVAAGYSEADANAALDGLKKPAATQEAPKKTEPTKKAEPKAVPAEKPEPKAPAIHVPTEPPPRPTGPLPKREVDETPFKAGARVPASMAHADKVSLMPDYAAAARRDVGNRIDNGWITPPAPEPEPEAGPVYEGPVPDISIYSGSVTMPAAPQPAVEPANDAASARAKLKAAGFDAAKVDALPDDRAILGAKRLSSM